MCRVCGGRAAGRSLSAARWRTPKRCCSSTTATASAREAHVGLDQRVRADDQRAAPRWRAARAISRRRRAGRGAGQQRGRHRLGAEQPLDRREVLLGERLGRRHQRRLAAVLDGAQHRVQRDHRLAAADLPHQQPLHRRAAREVARRSPRSPRRWSPVSANGSPSRSQRSVSAGARPARRAPVRLRRARAAAQEQQLREQQLLEGQPPARPPRARALAAAKCIAASAAALVGQPLATAQRGGQQLGDVRAARPRRPARA